MRQQIEIMLKLQDLINTRVHPDWRVQGFEWYRAIWVECAELMEHFGWKWWKKQSSDIQQVKLELVDIWHFGLSSLLQEDIVANIIEEQLIQGLNMSIKADFRKSIENFAVHVLENESFNTLYFGRLLNGAGLDFEALYTGYIAKNVLNFFRQHNGYKEGTYQNLWNGREDNDHLMEIIDTLDSDADDFKDQLYNALKIRYQSSI